jgi:hypothetical protein
VTRHPYIESVARFRCHDIPLNPVTGEIVEVLTSVDAIFVCADRDAAGIAAALDVAGRTEEIPIVVALDGSAGLAEALSGGSLGAVSRRIHPFRVFEAILEPAVLFDGVRETLARAIHDHFRASLGIGAEDHPANKPWEELPEDLRRSNRRQAADLPRKLETIDRALAPLGTLGSTSGELEANEIEILAAMEHESFVRERIESGWTLGPRDPQARTNPTLVDWGELDEESKEKTRAAIRALPDVLSRAGFRIVTREGGGDR